MDKRNSSVELRDLIIFILEENIFLRNNFLSLGRI